MSVNHVSMKTMMRRASLKSEMYNYCSLLDQIDCQ